MFLALFPCSEVFYVIAVFLAWVYIAFGIIGNNHAKEDIASYKNVGQVQENHFQIIERNNFDDRTYYWVNDSDNYSAVISEDPPLCFDYFSNKTIKPPPQEKLFHSTCPDSHLPNRAPPIV